MPRRHIGFRPKTANEGRNFRLTNRCTIRQFRCYLLPPTNVPASYTGTAPTARKVHANPTDTSSRTFLDAGLTGHSLLPCIRSPEVGPSNKKLARESLSEEAAGSIKACLNKRQIRSPMAVGMGMYLARKHSGLTLNEILRQSAFVAFTSSDPALALRLLICTRVAVRHAPAFPQRPAPYITFQFPSLSLPLGLKCLLKFLRLALVSAGVI